MLKALIFDFDGLVLDTESPDLKSWEEIYREYGVQFPISAWMASLGGSPNLFNPYRFLESQLDGRVNLNEIRAKKREIENELLKEQSPLPGVIDIIHEAKLLGLRLAIASSSKRDWVIPHLSRFGLLRRFDSIKCADDVTHTKPAPDLFHAVLHELGIKAENAIVFEDSPNGVLAAKSAGIFCVVVPNPVTSRLPMDDADLRLASLAKIQLNDLLQLVDRSIEY